MDGVGLMVAMLVFNYDNMSSNPADVYQNFFEKLFPTTWDLG